MRSGRSTLSIMPLLVAALALLASGARAEGEELDTAAACHDEVVRLCPDSGAGGAEHARCVRDVTSKLSPACRRLVMRRSSRTAGIEALRQVCDTEIDDHCDEVQRGSGRLLRCLRGLDDEKLSATCEGYLESLALARAKARGDQPAGE